MKFKNKVLTRNSVKKFPEGQLLVYFSDDDDCYFGLLHWREDNVATFWSYKENRHWEIESWNRYYPVSKDEYVLCRLENE